MLNQRRVAELDQAMQQLCEFYPLLLRGFYERLLEQGFSESASVHLTNTFLQTLLLKPAPQGDYDS